jgi:heme-degrading monooxygenase HmoA
MIVRIWRGLCIGENADAYERHVTRKVFPGLARIRGHRGAYLLRRHADGGVEFLAVTAWDSMKAIREFAKQDPDIAVVEPEAQAVLADFDRFVRHYDLVHGLKSPATE